MDRNFWSFCRVPPFYVALRKESVDRNTMRRDFRSLGLLSLSARRAWIEMDFSGAAWVQEFVALRKESVDRNREQFKYVVQCRKSLSARRAWIEIKSGLQPLIASLTSLSARRAWIEILVFAWYVCLIYRRSPQGERG